jgi:hypothetical protein
MAKRILFKEKEAADSGLGCQSVVDLENKKPGLF